MLNKIKKHLPILTYLTLLIMLFNLASCAYTAKAEDLMDGISAGQAESKTADARFLNGTAEFAINLIKNADSTKNVLLSPISAMTSISMAANGATDQTLDEIQSLYQNIPIEDMNQYLKGFLGSFTSDGDAKIKTANGIWFRDDPGLTVEKPFLQTNADYYNSQIYKAPFDNNTLNEINSWVKSNTDSMVDSILNEIKDDHIMYLLNAMAFDAKWRDEYKEESINTGTFTNADKTTSDVTFMHSLETTFLNDGRATGFLKPYKGEKYSFMALVPNDNISLDEYIQSLNADTFLNTLNSAKSEQVNCFLPKFSMDYDASLKDTLKALGVTRAFDPDNAQFSKLGHSTGGNIYMADVIQKTHIEVNEKGTKAAAATLTIMAEKTAAAPASQTVNLNRPFIYAVIDNTTNLPILMGAVNQL